MSEPKPSLREQFQGFPLVQILVISCIKLAEPIAFTSLFPYAFYMIRDFGIADSESEISTYAGYLAAVFAFGQFISAVFWGKIADIHGRKIVIIFGLVGSLISLLVLGFAKNFWMAFTARALMGLLNGNSGVSRSVIAETAPNKLHQGLAFLSMSVSWNVGGVIGPWIGGTLAHPRLQDSIGTTGFMGKYPYALPNVVISIILLVDTFAAFLFLKETHPELKHKHDRGFEVRDHVLLIVGLGPRPKDLEEILEEGSDETTSLISKDASIEEVMEVDSDTSSMEVLHWTKILTPQVLNPIFAYFIMQAHFTAYDEFLPIFVSYPPAYDKNGELESSFPINLRGGLGYTPHKSGNLLSTSGFCGMFMILLVFPLIDRAFSKNRQFRVALGIFPILFLIFPYVLLLLPQHIPEPFSTKSADIFLYGFVLFRVMVASVMGTLVAVSINSNARPGYVGVINGASISAASLASSMSPLFTGSLMSLGQKINMAGIGWWCLSFVTLCGFIQGCFIEVE